VADPRTVRRVAITAVLTLLCSLAGGVTPTSRAAGVCGSSGYAYAGVAATDRAYGVAAAITTLSPLDVLAGHVAGWVGVGGPGAGPHGTNEWLQVGFSGFPGSSMSSLYYEVARPNQAPIYQELASDLSPGTTKKVAVSEIRYRPNWWRVSVDDQPVGSPVYLPASHGAWRPMATAETWGAGTFVCNRFRYKFGAVSIATRVGGAWLPLRRLYTFHDHGYRITRAGTYSYVAGN
jgi:hypothetical protein